MSLEDLFKEEDIEDIERLFAKVDHEMANTSKHRTLRDWFEDPDEN